MKVSTQETEIPSWAIKLKAIRIKLNESQEQFGTRWDVSKMTVSYWEAGTYEPPAKVLIWLMTGSETMK